MTRPLSKPILSGPTFGVGVWGLSEFEAVGSKDKYGIMVFEERGFYYRDCTPETWNGYVVEGFVLPSAFKPAIRKESGKEVVSAFHPFYQGTGALFDLRVIRLPKQQVFIGMLVNRLRFQHNAPSGFTFGGPSDGTHMLNAIYPLPAFAQPDRSLDYQPDHEA